MTHKQPISSVEAGTFFIAAIIISQASWSIAFQLGAFNTIAYNHLFMVLAASISALIASLIINKTREGEVYFSWMGSLILILPCIWFVYGMINNQSNTSVVDYILSILVLVLSLPYVGYLLLTAAVPEVSEIKQKKLKMGLIFISFIVFVIAYLAGYFNYYIMQCDDFNSTFPPKNCYQESLVIYTPEWVPKIELS